jgi:hypothetical protein
VKLAVIVNDSSAMIHTGADMDRTVRVFEMPPEVAEFIGKVTHSYCTVSLAIVTDPEKSP